MGQKGYDKKGSQNKFMTRKGQRRRNSEDEGIRSSYGAIHGNTEGVWAKGIPRFERLGKRRG